MDLKKFNNAQAENMLMEFCNAENQDISLLTINLLFYTRNNQPFIKSNWESYEMPDQNYNITAACMDFLGSLGLVPNNFNFKD